MELKEKSNNILNGIIFAISYFSALPFRLKGFEANEKFYRGVIYGLPLTGAILALVSIFSFFIFNLFFPSFYSAFLSSMLYLFFYGFLHLEGLADTIDGWYASLSNKDVYKIMKEPSLGAMGAIGTFALMLLKIAVLSYLFYLEAFLGIFIVLILSRLSVYFILDLELHEKSSFLLSMQKSKKDLYFLNIFLFPLKLLVLFVINKIKKRIGFINGDITGFTIEIIEILLLHFVLFLCI